jgi:hypothetical protein
MPVRATPLWICPECRHRFVTRNLWHSCGRYRLADHFRGRSKVVRELFDRWRALARSCGPVTVYAQKTRIVFQTRVRFAGAVVHNDWLDASLWLKRRANHPCAVRTECFGPLGYGVHFRLTNPDDIDSELKALMSEAYATHAPGGAAALPDRRPARNPVKRVLRGGNTGVQRGKGPDCADLKK